MAAALLTTALVLEDSAEPQRVLVAMLERVATTVLAANNVMDAAGISEQHPGPIDLLVGTVRSRGRYTDEIVKRIYAARPSMPTLLVSTRPVNVLVTSGYIDPERVRT